MKITMKLFATLRDYARGGRNGTCYLELPEQATVQTALDSLGIPREIPKILLINGRQRTLLDPLSDSDTLSVFPPIAGG